MKNLVIVYVDAEDRFFIPKELDEIGKIFNKNENNLSLAIKIINNKFKNYIGFKMVADQYEINKNKKFHVKYNKEFLPEPNEEWFQDQLNNHLKYSKDKKMIFIVPKRFINKIYYK
jgi:hypothetical protein